MSSKSKIICLGLPAYEGNYLKSTVQLVNELTEFHEVFYIEYTYTALDVLKGIFGNKKVPFKRILGLKPRLRTFKLSENRSIKVLTLPAILPINWIENQKVHQWASKFNAKIIEYSIRWLISKEKIDNPLIINAFQPNYGLHLSEKFNEKATIYYCYDEISQADWCKKHGTQAEEKFMKVVDAVVVSSKALEENKKRIQPNTFLVKNGVDIEIFSQNRKGVQKPRKVIGYVGSIDNRLDLKLLKSIFERFSKYDFLFIGRILDSNIYLQLQAYKNVKFVGAKQPNELAELMQIIDIGLIPFIKNEFTKNIYPLKINEYLASGMPVVSTNFADLSDFEGLIYESTESEFGLNLIKAINENEQNLIKKRVAFAQENSWRNRAKAFSKIIKNLENDK